MQSFKSKEYVKEQFAWRHYYWYLTNEGIEFLRVYLNLPAEIVPATMKKSTTGRPPTTGVRPPFEGGRGGEQRGGGGDRPPRAFGGDREGYRSDKGGAPGAYQPRFGGGGEAPPRGP